jgi:hypothetical protein
MTQGIQKTEKNHRHLAIAIIVCLLGAGSFLYWKQAHAAEPASEPAAVEEVAPATEPAPAADESSTAGRVSRAFGYLFSGDASNIVAEVNEDLEQRQKAADERDAQLTEREAALSKAETDVSQKRDEVLRRIDEVNAQREALTACVLKAIGGEEHAE